MAFELQFSKSMKRATWGILFLAQAAFAEDFVLKSKAFINQGEIPAKYTCEGENVSPPLSWSGAPAKTKFFVLIVDDPDAPDPAKPEKVVTHWLVYNISANTHSLKEGVRDFPAGSMRGYNEVKKPDYMGPCPPIGKHRYFFKIFALDNNFHFIARPTKADLERSMTGHILAQSELIGLYAKKEHKD